MFDVIVGCEDDGVSDCPRWCGVYGVSSGATALLRLNNVYRKETEL